MLLLLLLLLHRAALLCFAARCSLLAATLLRCAALLSFGAALHCSARLLNARHCPSASLAFFPCPFRRQTLGFCACATRLCFAAFFSGAFKAFCPPCARQRSSFIFFFLTLTSNLSITLLGISLPSSFALARLSCFLGRFSFSHCGLLCLRYVLPTSHHPSRTACARLHTPLPTTLKSSFRCARIAACRCRQSTRGLLLGAPSLAACAHFEPGLGVATTAARGTG